VLGVALASQLVGTLISLVLAILVGETLPLAADVPWSIAGGLTGGSGSSRCIAGLPLVG
jgi:hypothetical protein